MPKVVYKSRTDFLISKLNQEEDLDTEDHIVQLPWQPEQMPTNEELKKRQEIRKEQGQKLKEMMARKRNEKKKAMEIELADLQSLSSLKDTNQNSLFKEEIQSRNLANFENY